MGSKPKYYIVEAAALPEVFLKVAEAKRLLKFLDYFLGVPSESIPSNSILREFIGGSTYK